MRSDAPGLLPVLRSRHQADLLTLLLLHPEREYAISDLARRLSVPQSTISGEVRRLTDAGILTVRSVGRSRLVRTNTDSRLVPALAELLLMTFGPSVVVEEEFTDVAGVSRVVLFGSWAARYLGERGRAPNDVDVLVVGAPDRMAMYEAAQRAEVRLERPVNPTVVSADQWEHPTDGFIQEIQSRPYVTVIGAGE